MQWVRWIAPTCDMQTPIPTYTLLLCWQLVTFAFFVRAYLDSYEQLRSSRVGSWCLKLGKTCIRVPQFFHERTRKGLLNVRLIFRERPTSLPFGWSVMGWNPLTYGQFITQPPPVGSGPISDSIDSKRKRKGKNNKKPNRMEVTVGIRFRSWSTNQAWRTDGLGAREVQQSVVFLRTRR